MQSSLRKGRNEREYCWQLNAPTDKNGKQNFIYLFCFLIKNKQKTNQKHNSDRHRHSVKENKKYT